jgi:ethanolamine transporter EutH
MTNRFETFLENIGKDFEHGLQKLQPVAEEVLGLAAKAAPFVSMLDPAIGPLFTTVVATVSGIEQKFAAMGKQTGSGTQKLTEATTILQPVIAQAFAAAGKPSDAATVQKYISAVVGFLNAIPASTTTEAPAPAAPTVSSSN